MQRNTAKPLFLYGIRGFNAFWVADTNEPGDIEKSNTHLTKVLYSRRVKR
jgi:hypothetical protein